MPNVRLFGLVLIMTSVLLGLAALATHTTTIRVGVPTSADHPEDGQRPHDENAAEQVHFEVIPIAYPLIAACLVGLALWFLPEVLRTNSLPQQQARRKRTRRK